MPRSLSGQQNSTPIVGLISKVGNYLIGTLKGGPRIVRLKRGSGQVFEFELLETNSPVQKKVGDQYVQVETKQGDTVSVFAPTALAGALKEAKMGEIIQMEYLGKKLNKAGTEFHGFQVDALTKEEYDASR